MTRRIEELAEDIFSKLSPEDNRTVESWLEMKLNSTYLLGQSVGLSDAASTVMVKAATAFETGDDDLAAEYRKTAKELKALSEAKREQGDIE